MTIDLSLVLAILVWTALLAYGIFGGADFGAGIWDMLSFGKRAEKQRIAIAHALGPVWEANNVWLIFAIVGAFTCFPLVFSSLSTALFIPLNLALVGIVLRGTSFVFRSSINQDGFSPRWKIILGRIFSASSVVTPFIFGTCAAAIASGNIRVIDGQVQTNYWTIWTTPFAITCGLFALGICSCLAATYLTVEATMNHGRELEQDFLWRALLSGAFTALMGGMALLLASGNAPQLWQGLMTHALPFVGAAMLIGICTAGMLLFHHYQIARILIMGEIAAIFAAWALAQYPVIIAPDITIFDAAAQEPMLRAFLISSLFGMILFLPSLAFLFIVFKGKKSLPSRASN
jgi:cytochrome d ubiquinol oxidase subunit II